MFVTYQNFELPPYQIPNLVIDPDDETFSLYEDKAERDALSKILGRLFYNAVSAAESADPVPTIYQTLFDGADYEYLGKLYHWEGMTKALTPFIYYKWLKTHYDKHTELGIVVGDTENSKIINPALRMVEAHNEFVNLFGGQCKMENTLYGYLFVNYLDFQSVLTEGSIYSDFKRYILMEFKAFKKINTFNL